MPESPIAEVTGATLDARTDLDAQEIDGGLEPTEDMDHVFVDRPASEHQPAQKASEDLTDPRRDSVEENAVQLYTDDPGAASRSSSDDPAEETGPVEMTNVSIEGAGILRMHNQQPQVCSGIKGDSSDGNVKTQADQAVPATASAAALAAAAVTSAVATSTVPTMQIPSGLSTGAPPYASFTPLAPNGTPMMPHSLVSVPMTVGRRAVRIAPMGVLPLPPQSGVTASLVPDLSTSNNTSLVAAAGRTEAGNLEGQMNSTSGNAGATIGDMPKGKRRGVPGAAPVNTEGLTPEERTKQKRMLRNRESAARSRDKRKTKNTQLETSIDKHKKKKVVLDMVICELQDVIDCMQQGLNRHNISLSC